MSKGHRSNRQTFWEKVDRSDVPTDVQSVMEVLLQEAATQGCTCDPEVVSVPTMDTGAVIYAVVAHESSCLLNIQGREN